MGVINNIPEMPYNISTVEGYYDWLAMAQPLFWPVMLFSLMIILFGRNINLGASRSAIVATLVTGISGIFISVLGWIDPKWMYLFGILFGASMVWRHLESGQ